MGIDPTGRNARRAAGDGDPARSSGAVLGQERERDDVRGRDEWVWGSWNSPCPLLTPTRSRRRGSTAGHRGSTAWAEVPHTRGSIALLAAVKNYYCDGSGSTVPWAQLCKHMSHPSPAVIPWLATVVPQTQESASFVKKKQKRPLQYKHQANRHTRENTKEAT